MRSGGHGFCGIGRKRLLHIRQDRCVALGVDLVFETDAQDDQSMAAQYQADPAIASDGLNSRIRYASACQPDADAALRAYEAVRSVEVLKIQNAARNSTEWFENVNRYSGLQAEQWRANSPGIPAPPPMLPPLSVRISAHGWAPGGNTADDAVEIARLFKATGCDFIDVSSGQTMRAARPVYGRMYQPPFADRIRNEVGIQTIAVGAISEADQVNNIIAAGRADLSAPGPGRPGPDAARSGQAAKPEGWLAAPLPERPGSALPRYS